MPRRFEYLGEQWEATATGTGHSVGFGDAVREVNRWGVIFRSLAHPERREFRASMSERDPAGVPEEELRRILDEQLVLAAINRSRFVWRPAEAIASDTGLQPDYVRQILENTAPNVIAGGQNKDGLWLYTTEDHLEKTSGDVMRKHFKVEESS